MSNRLSNRIENNLRVKHNLHPTERGDKVLDAMDRVGEAKDFTKRIAGKVAVASAVILGANAYIGWTETRDAQLDEAERQIQEDLEYQNELDDFIHGNMTQKGGPAPESPESMDHHDATTEPNKGGYENKGGNEAPLKGGPEIKDGE